MQDKITIIIPSYNEQEAKVRRYDGGFVYR